MRSTGSAAWARACRSRSRQDGRRILWLAHESAPKNFTAVDVTDPRSPKIVVQTDLPQAHMRSNSLETGRRHRWRSPTRRRRQGLQPAGFELFDISMPENPKSISFFDCSGPNSRGVHQLWFCDGEYVHMSSGAPRLHADPPERRPVLPLHRRAQPVEAGRGRPLVAARHAAGRQRERRRRAIRAATPASARTTPTSIRSAPDRCYLGYIDGGMFILDIADKANPKMVSQLGPTPALSPASRTPSCRSSTAA